MKTKLYVWVFASLVALTGLTLAAAHYHMGTAFAIAIAAAKATLVGLFFMHLKNETRLTSFVALFPVLLWIVLIVLIFPDFLPPAR